MISNDFEFFDKSIRLAFVRKVYSILMCQLAVTLGVVAFFRFHQPTIRWVKSFPEIVFIALGVTFVCLISMACCTSVRRKTPMNFIFLSIFTLAEAFLLGVITTFYTDLEILIALGTTTAVCVCLTLFAMQTKYDFTAMGGALLVCSVILLIFGIFTIFFHNKILMIFYGCAGALIFSLYLVFDTQLMMGGNHKYSISPEEYIFAALSLYIDVVNIFIFILTIIGAVKD